MRYFIKFSYNGKAYHGWQYQPNAISVQEVLEKGLSTLLGGEISVMGAGRTDAGVHATEMFAHFEYETCLEDASLVFRLNSFLPEDIAIQNIFRVKPEVHARFSALHRTYLYRIALKKNPFNTNNAFYVKQHLDIEKMNAAAKVLFDYKDFQCFSKTNTDVKTYHCTITKAEWVLKKDELHFTIQANRFLRNMVRSIVGTMINIGLGKMDVKALDAIIKSKNRSEAGFSVPAHGLHLIGIAYSEDIKLENE